MEYFQKGLCQISQVMTAILFNSYIRTVILSGIHLIIAASLLIKARLIQIINSVNFLRPDLADIISPPFPKTLLGSVYGVNNLSAFQGIFGFNVNHHSNLLESFPTVCFCESRFSDSSLTINYLLHPISKDWNISSWERLLDMFTAVFYTLISKLKKKNTLWPSQGRYLLLI